MRSRSALAANVPPANLVQIGIGGWIGNHSGVHVADKMGTTVMTMFGVDERGIDDVMDIAMETAWKDADAVYLSLDIDEITPVRHRLPATVAGARRLRAARPRRSAGDPL